MPEEHITKTQETRWDIAKHQAVVVIVSVVVIVLAWVCGWMVGAGS